MHSQLPWHAALKQGDMTELSETSRVLRVLGARMSEIQGAIPKKGQIRRRARDSVPAGRGQADSRRAISGVV